MKYGTCSLRDVALAAGVDPSTVSRALRGSSRVAAGTRERVLAIAKSMDYTPNVLAQALKGQRTRTIGILVASLELPFFVDLLRAQERWLYRNGYVTVVSVSHGSPPREQADILARMQSRAVEGVCIGFPDPNTVDAYHAAAAAGVPLCAYCEKSCLHELDSIPMSLAVCDLSRGVSLLIDHLISLSHERIAFVGYLNMRQEEFQQAVQEHGLMARPDYVLAPGNESDGAVAETCKRLCRLDPAPTAVVVQSDEMAVRLIKALSAAGRDVPGDISVVGINNNPVGELIPTPLTTLALPTGDIGEWMAEAVARDIETSPHQPEVRYFPTNVIVRASTAPALSH
ncbi:MAG: LacI family DNA-binding transcriptional regulator [Lentisphaerae bacterium]|nr:LacI family DNA-binding transcriptional regulator [Lentisphaerota bacterium]MBT4816847.1 LacI family DNA-binding transcriptional regulator [Lentisphaerota bacterium]MBT5612203.1 LacI family DNA-binding transcriptional regulator [Lentisphaerota bacterium]MBT7061130.1 LacI family DNA-binding transcriptional regulator [Lentisphaerota bacterium]MBT7843459.1 LacI family DNA-binding transcriptional regulator [Lentisphaerota bacterium]